MNRHYADRPARAVAALYTDASAEGTEVRTLLADRQHAGAVIADAQKRKDEVSQILLDYAFRWAAEHPMADAFDIGVNEELGVLRIAVQQNKPRESLDRGLVAQKLAECGVPLGIIETALAFGTVSGNPAEPFLTVRQVKNTPVASRERLDVARPS